MIVVRVLGLWILAAFAVVGYWNILQALCRRRANRNRNRNRPLTLGQVTSVIGLDEGDEALGQFAQPGDDDLFCLYHDAYIDYVRADTTAHRVELGLSGGWGFLHYTPDQVTNGDSDSSVPVPVPVPYSDLNGASTAMIPKGSELMNQFSVQLAARLPHATDELFSGLVETLIRWHSTRTQVVVSMADHKIVTVAADPHDWVPFPLSEHGVEVEVTEW